MKISELYAREPDNIKTELDYVFNYVINHTGIEDVAYLGIETASNKRITVHVYKEYHFDHKCYWLLAAVKLDDQFVMVIQNAGRHGEAVNRKFVTNAEAYKQMNTYLYSLAKTPDPDEVEVIDTELELDNLAEYYDHKLDGWFGRF